MSRPVDRGAITAAYVGIGVAVTVGISFLLVIPIEPIYSIAGIPFGFLIAWYANARAGRGRGEWRWIVPNALLASGATALTMAVLLLAVKALFFAGDDGYRDPGLGGRIECTPGAECVYRRYVARQGEELAAAGVRDVDGFTAYYWDQQRSASLTLFGVTLAAGTVAALAYGVSRPRR